MKRATLLASSLFILAVGSFAAAKAYDQVALGEADLANGKAQYEANCVACHGAAGHGDGIAAADLSVSPDNIAEELANPFGFKMELINSVYTGDNGQEGVMPAFGDVMTKSDINDALEYIRSIN